MADKIAEKVHEKLKCNEMIGQRAATLLAAAASDYRSYVDDFQDDMSTRERRRVLSKAKRLEKRAEKLGGRPIEWLLNANFLSLFTEQERNDMINLHPTELEEWAERALR